MTNARRSAPGSPSVYSDSLLQRFDNLSVEPRTPDHSILDDDFRPPTPPRTPSTTIAPDPVAPPPLALPPTAIANLGRNYRPGNQATTSTSRRYSAINPRPTTDIQVLPLAAQRHINKTVQRKDTRSIRKKYNKTINRGWLCETCKIGGPNNSTKDAHEKGRKHYLKSIYKESSCTVCNQKFFSPDDFKRHCNSKAHLRKLYTN